MGSSNITRLLDYAIEREGYTFRNYVQRVTENHEIVQQGSYFCDAENGSIEIKISPLLNREGVTINVKKVDSTNNIVVVNAKESGGIDGQDEVRIFLQHENLQIQKHQAAWHIL